MGSHRHLRFPSMSLIYKCSFRKPEWCFCFSRFGEESFFASTVTRLKPALSVFSIAIELKLIIACKGTDNKLVSQDGFHRTLTPQFVILFHRHCIRAQRLSEIWQLMSANCGNNTSITFFISTFIIKADMRVMPKANCYSFYFHCVSKVP